MRILLLVIAALAVLCGVALAEDAVKPAQTIVHQGDTFPASLGYAFLTAASAAGTVIGTVVTKMWFRLQEQVKEHNADLATLREEHTADRKELLGKLEALQGRLDVEQDARRTEQERLLREQKDIMREVMTTCAGVGTTLAANTEVLNAVKKILANAGLSG